MTFDGLRNVLMYLATVLLVPAGKGLGNNPSFGAPSQSELSSAIDLATSYTERVCGLDGRFAYKISIQAGGQSSSYNIVRHAGVIYALAMLQDKADDLAVGTAVRAAAFLQKNYIGPVVYASQQVVWSKPLPESSAADLGATGLGLVALAAVKQERPRAVPLEELQGLGNFLVFMQRGDGSFFSKYRPYTGPDEEFESLYYPGEAALGLIDLYKIDHNERWRTSATKALLHLARSRAKLTDVPPDHWALIATAELLQRSSADVTPQVREALIDHAIQICHALMKGQQRTPESPLEGSFDPTGRTAPTATRMEGLLAALEFLPDDSLRTEIKDTVDHGIAFLIRAQIRNGIYAGAMPNAVIASSPDAFYVRIDFVQHALCAFLRYQRMFQTSVVDQATPSQ